MNSRGGVLTIEEIEAVYSRLLPECFGGAEAVAPATLSTAAGEGTWNGADVIGTLNPTTLDGRLFGWSVAPRAKTYPGDWKDRTGTLREFLKKLATRHSARTNKDGAMVFLGVLLNGVRSKKNVASVHCLALDFDGGACFDDVVEELRVAGQFAVVATSFSHSSGKHKFRVILPLREPFEVHASTSHTAAVDLWSRTYKAVSNRFGGASADEACTDISRAFYQPAHPFGTVAHRTVIVGGALLDLATLEPVPDTKRLARAGRGANADKEPCTKDLKKFVARFGDVFMFDDWMGEMYADVRGSAGSGHSHPCPNRNEHSEPDAPDDTGFVAWNGADNGDRFGAFCHHAHCQGLDRLHFLDLACVEMGVADARELLSLCPEVEGRAHTLKDERVGGGSDGPEGFPDLEAFTAALGDAGEDHGKLKAVMARLGASRGLDAMDQAEAKKRFMAAAKMKAAEFNNALKAAKARAREMEGERNDEEELHEMNREYAFINMTGRVRVLQEPYRRGQMPNLFTVPDFHNWTAKRRVPGEEGATGDVPVSTLWMRWPERREYSGLVFEPGGTADTNYNLWRGFAVAGKEGDWGLLRGHLFENVCRGDETSFCWLMTWFSQMFQQPGEKLGSAVAIKGKRGAGKSKVFDWVRKAMGQHAIQVTHAKSITGNFNAHQTGLILMVCEEAFWAGDPAAQGTLKSLITSNVQLLEKKGVDAVGVSNHMRLAFVSNEEWVVPVSGDDERRFFVLECGDARRKDRAFFAAVDDQMTNGGLEAMVFEFMHWTPPGGDWGVLRDPPQGLAHADQALAGLGMLGRLLVRLACGEVVRGKGRESGKLEVSLSQVEGEDWSTLDRDEFLAVLETFYASERLPSDQAILRAMRTVFGEVKPDRVRSTPLEVGNGKGERYRVYKLDPAKKLLSRLGAAGWAH